MGTTNFKIGFTTAAAVALGCAISAGLVYLIQKKRFPKGVKQHLESEFRQAAQALDYLNIEIITTEDECNVAVEEIRRRCSHHKAIGFDCEWVTMSKGTRQPVALVQLSSLDGYCGLFRLCKMESFPHSLKDLLEDDSIYKVGVAPIDDAKYLAQDYSVHPRSTVDIRHLALLIGGPSGGLAALSKALLGIILDKNWRVQCSDWSAQELTERQVQYAAADAHVAIRIYTVIAEALHGAGLTAGTWRDCWEGYREVCSKYADVPFKIKRKEKLNGSTSKPEKRGRAERQAPACKPYPHATRSKPLYHNCFLEAPDGELLCTCDNKKAHWYVEKGLADIVKVDPLTVRLRFQPAGRSVGDVGRYYQLAKDNRCVVCGSGHSYIRKNVVPREYRKYFPEIMKEHSSHDVVLLCARCHQRSNTLDRAVREQLAAACGAPLAARGHARYVEDDAARKVRSAARALLYQSKKHVLPEARRRELEAVLLQHFPAHDQITQELLEEGANMQYMYENLDYESHGQRVVQQYARGGGLLRLEELWRRHFLDGMRPRYMPELWSLTHNEDRLRVRLNEGRLNEEDAKLLGL